MSLRRPPDGRVLDAGAHSAARHGAHSSGGLSAARPCLH